MSAQHRFICPHCHAPIDPARMEPARHGVQQYRICPECDEAIVWIATVRSELHDPTISSSDDIACSA